MKGNCIYDTDIVSFSCFVLIRDLLAICAELWNDWFVCVEYDKLRLCIMKKLTAKITLIALDLDNLTHSTHRMQGRRYFNLCSKLAERMSGIY